MTHAPKQLVEDVRSGDRSRQGEAYQFLMKATEEPVDWAYSIWDHLVDLLEKGDNRARSIAAQVLCNLAKSDPDNRMPKTIPKLMAVTRDEKFVTARHSLQALWRVGVVNPELTGLTVDALAGRFEECTVEKNRTMIRYDITCVLKTIFDHTGDASIAERSLALIGTEPEEKCRAKCLKEWKALRK